VTKEEERIYCLEAEIYLDYEDKKDQHRLSMTGPGHKGSREKFLENLESWD
jgi:hypothetical protein